MKNYLNYLNENLILFLKNAFKLTFSKLSENRQKINLEIINNISQSDSFLNMINFIKSSIDKTNNVQITNIDSLKQVLQDDILTIDVVLKSLSKKFNNKELRPNNFFKNYNNKLIVDIFMYDNEIEFHKNLNFNLKKIIYQFLKQLNLTDIDIKKILDSNTKLFELQTVEPLQNTDKLKQDVQNQNNQDNQDQDQDNKDQNQDQNNQNQNNNNKIDFETLIKNYIIFKNTVYSFLFKKLSEIQDKYKKEEENTKNF